MIIFIHEDPAYLSWVARHRDGFVVDWLRRPTRKHPVLHRASCATIKATTGKKTHWTTGRHLKACSQDLDELQAWIKDEGSDKADICSECQPLKESISAESHGHLTTLSRELLEYTLEVAVMLLDQRVEAYSVTLADLAQQSQKTPAQISSAVARLFECAYLTTDRLTDPANLRDSSVVYPTERALRTLPAFAELDAAQIECELRRLYSMTSPRSRD